MLAPQDSTAQDPKPKRAVDPNVRAAEQELQRALGVRVTIRDNKGKGKIVIEYASLEDFDRVIETLSNESA
jgi:ParB family chromosome partitioning protein